MFLGNHLIQVDHLHLKGQNDYLRQWLPHFQDYLNLLLGREAPPKARICCVCSSDGVFRCQDCFGEPLYCTGCLRKEHRRLPFHRVKQWTSAFFQETSLKKAGFELHLGHDGMPCPATGHGADIFDWDDMDEQVSTEELADLQGAWIPVHHDAKTLTIVDKSGVHEMSIHYCDCLGSNPIHQQLFQMGLFPASFTRPRTAFTFAVLDDFLLDNLECGTSASNYYNKLRRLTCSILPHLVPVSGLLNTHAGQIDICNRTDTGS
jgi:hypothetical protein